MDAQQDNAPGGGLAAAPELSWVRFQVRCEWFLFPRRWSRQASPEASGRRLRARRTADRLMSVWSRCAARQAPRRRMRRMRRRGAGLGLSGGR